MTQGCNSRQYVEAGFILHEHLPHSAANISAASPSAFLPLSQPNYTGLFEYTAHNKPTQLPRLPISHKDTMLAQPTARRWGGWEKALFKLIEVAALTLRLFSLISYFGTFTLCGMPIHGAAAAVS